jgi:hypothetical protein
MNPRRKQASPHNPHHCHEQRKSWAEPQTQPYAGRYENGHLHERIKLPKKVIRANDEAQPPDNRKTTQTKKDRMGSYMILGIPVRTLGDSGSSAAKREYKAAFTAARAAAETLSITEKTPSLKLRPESS